MDALDLLKEQHEEVDQLFKKFVKLDEDATAERRELFIMIADRLSAHATIEELYFYPAIKTDKTEDKIREAVEEHLGVKRFIADLLDMDASDEQFAAKMKVLQENVEHHVEEEEDDLFKRVRSVLDKDQRFALGVQMKTEFDELMKSEPRNEVPSQTDEAAPV